MSNTKSISFRTNKTTYELLKLKSKETGIPFSHLIRNCMEDYLNTSSTTDYKLLKLKLILMETIIQIERIENFNKNHKVHTTFDEIQRQLIEEASDIMSNIQDMWEQRYDTIIKENDVIK